MGAFKKLLASVGTAPQQSELLAEALGATSPGDTKRRRHQVEEISSTATPSPAEDAVCVAGKKRKKEASAESKPAAESKEPAETAELEPVAYREKMMIMSEAELPDPVQSFNTAPFGKKARIALMEAGFRAPTPIHAQGWPLAVRGNDLVTWFL